MNTSENFFNSKRDTCIKHCYDKYFELSNHKNYLKSVYYKFRLNTCETKCIREWYLDTKYIRLNKKLKKIGYESF